MKYSYNDSPACRLEKISDDLYCLKEVGLVNIYLLVGTKKALLIDTGYGYTDYRPLIRSVTDLPLIVVNTHGDPDHALGSYLFEKVYLAEEDYKNILKHDNPAFKLNSIKFRYSVMPEVIGLIDEDQYCNTSLRNTRFEFITEGDTFDLGGGQIIEVYNTPGHSNGSVSLLDKKNRRFFTGDVITYHNIWNFGSLERSSFPVMFRTYKKAKKLQSFYDEVYPSHGPKPLPKTVVDELIECIYDIRDNHGHEELLKSALADSISSVKKYSHPYKNVLIIYSDEQLDHMLKNGLDE